MSSQQKVKPSQVKPSQVKPGKIFGNVKPSQVKPEKFAGLPRPGAGGQGFFKNKQKVLKFKQKFGR